MMRPLVFTFLALFVLTGVAGLVPGLEALRFTLAALAVALALPLYLALALDRALPKAVLLPPILYLGWAVFAGGFPLAFLGWEQVATALAIGQVVLGCGVLVALAHREEPAERSGFSWANFLALGALAAVLGPALLVAGGLNLAGRQMEARSGGYVKLRPGGLVLEEREFRRGGQSVRLVGMMHIGSPDFYREIFASFAGEDRRIVLLEGVTDEQRLLTSRLSYAGLARAFGLEAQEKSELSNPEVAPASHGERTDRTITFRHADVDVSSFSPGTLAFINTLGALLASPTVPAAMATLQREDSPLRDPAIEALVMRDILDGRNGHLMTEIDAALERGFGTVIVPWGALHLPHVEAELRARGFEDVGRKDRVAVGF